MRLPVIAASRPPASRMSHCVVGPAAGSPSRATSILKPVVNVSGSTTRSVRPASGSSIVSKRDRLAGPSCHTSGCWTSETRRALIGTSCARGTSGELVEARRRLIEGAVALGHAQAHERERRGCSVERRQRDGGDPRLGEQPLGEGEIVAAGKRAEIQQLKVGALRRRQCEPGARKRAAQAIALTLEKGRQLATAVGM